MSLKSKIEATLFVTGKAMKINEISGIVKADAKEVEEALLELIMDYASQDGALEIDDEDGYIIQVKDEYSDIVNKIMPIEISDNILKTLTIITIKQPILQSELVNIRGICAYDHINCLIDQDLITKKPKGKSYLLKTTSKFLEYFKFKGDTEELVKLLDRQVKN